MLDQKALSTGVSGGDTVIAWGMPGAPTTRHDPYTTANAPGSAIDRGDAVRATRALLGI
jgi:hypothetical protein